jgi:hypothetical protein
MEPVGTEGPPMSQQEFYLFVVLLLTIMILHVWGGI